MISVSPVSRPPVRRRVVEKTAPPGLFPVGSFLRFLSHRWQTAPTQDFGIGVRCGKRGSSWRLYAVRAGRYRMSWILLYRFQELLFCILLFPTALSILGLSYRLHYLNFHISSCIVSRPCRE